MSNYLADKPTCELIYMISCNLDKIVGEKNVFTSILREGTIQLMDELERRGVRYSIQSREWIENQLAEYILLMGEI